MAASKVFIDDMVDMVRNCIVMLRGVVHDAYPPMIVVEIDTGHSLSSRTSFKGIGIVVNSDDQSPLEILIELENGNRWSYPIDSVVRRIDDPSEWPMWARNRIAQFTGAK